MASEAQCDAALHALVAALAGVDPDVRRKYVLARTVSCRVPDLGVTWSARLGEDGLEDLTKEDSARAQVRLTVGSDDLIALTAGRLAVPAAVALGKIRVQASPIDLLRLSHFL